MMEKVDRRGFFKFIPAGAAVAAGAAAIATEVAAAVPKQEENSGMIMKQTNDGPKWVNSPGYNEEVKNVRR
jgi:hypothetical protein